MNNVTSAAGGQCCWKWGLRIAAQCLLVVLLVAGVARGQGANCASATTNPFLRALTRHREQTCWAGFQQLRLAGGVSGIGCSLLARRKCCSTSNCPKGHICTCASNCGIRTCHLDPTQSMGLHCPQLLPPAHGYLHLTGLPGRVRVMCNSTHQLRGASELQCSQKTQKWSAKVPSCLDRVCPLPRLPGDIHFKGSGQLKTMYAQNETLRVECDGTLMIVPKRTGQRLRRSRVLKCRRNGQWKNMKKLKCRLPPPTNAPQPATCCPIPSAPLHGTRTQINRFCIGETMHFQCKECYRLVGEKSSSCVDLAKFRQPDVRCEAIQCPKPVLPRGFSIVGSHIPSPYTCGNELSVACSSPAPTAAPLDNFFCDSNGTWQGLQNLRTYMCKATSGPWNLTVTNTTTTRIDLTWRPPLEHPSEVSHYTIKYLQAGSSLPPVHRTVDRTASKTVTAAIAGLMPNTQYHVQVNAVFQTKYPSAPTDWRAASTRPLPPLPQPDKVQVSNSYRGRLSKMMARVSWSPPLALAGVDSTVRYEVHYSTQSPVTSPYAFTDYISTSLTSVVLQNLQPYTPYTISVATRVATRASLPVEQDFTLKSGTLRPRMPPAPLVQLNGTLLVVALLPSPDIHPFVWRYSLHATCDEPISVNSLEENERTGSPRCPRTKSIALHRLPARTMDAAPDGYVEYRMDLAQDMRLLSGRRYRLQVGAKTRMRASSSWSKPAFFTVDPQLQQQADTFSNDSQDPGE